MGTVVLETSTTVNPLRLFREVRRMLTEIETREPHFYAYLGTYLTGAPCDTYTLARILCDRVCERLSNLNEQCSFEKTYGKNDQ